MILDIIIGLVVLVSCIVGYKCGLASMLSHLGSWLVATVLAFILCSPLKIYLCQSTGIDEYFYAKFAQRLTPQSSGRLGPIPDLFKDEIASARSHFVNATATQLTDIVMAIFAFLIILIGVKLIAFAFGALFSKKHNRGFIGFTDGLIGLFLGFIVGLILVVTLMAMAVPFAMSSFDGFAKYYEIASKDAIIAPYFYDYNLILVFIKSFLL